MITEDTINFLKGIPPFKFLDETALRSIAGSLSLEFFPKHSLILTQDGPPSDSLKVIKKGGVKIYMSNDNDEIVIDFKSEGDSFGYLSLISGDKSRANIRAVEDTLCYIIPKNIILGIMNNNPDFGKYYMKSFFKNYLDKTYSEMRSKNLLFKEGEKLLYTTPVRDIISKRAVTVSGDETIKAAAGIMSEHGISSVVIQDKQGSPSGIVTDRDLRDKVVARGTDPLRPVREIMSTDLVKVASDSTCFDALSIMIQSNIHHLLITEGDSLSGVVTNHDFMLLQGTSPLSILKSIDRQQDTEELMMIRDRINQTIAILLKDGVKASYILRIITELHDRLIQKIIQLSLKHIGDADCRFAFFVYGAEGRKEETFKTVFRCAIVYNEINDYSKKKHMEECCARLVKNLQDTFSACGLPLFDVHPFGGQAPIYGDVGEWEKNILNALRSGESARVMKAKKMLDLRAIYGDAAIVAGLQDRLYLQIRENSKYSSVLYEYTATHMSPIGFFKKFVVDESGKQQDEYDIKGKGTSHFVDALRALAIASNVHETATLERLKVLTKDGIFRREMHNDINAAFEFLLQLLMQAQLVKRELDLPIDNVIEPDKLSMLEKKSLKEVFQVIPLMQETVKSCFQRQTAAVR